MTQLDVQQAVERNFARIYRAALVMTGNPWDADDLAQETFLIVARDVAKFKHRSRLYTWIYGILLNVERRARRRLGMQRRKLEQLRANSSPSDAVALSVETAVESEEWKRSLWAQVSKLPEAQRQTLVLRFSEGLRYNEIAEIMDCPLGTVKSRIFNGLTALRASLEAEPACTSLMPARFAQDINNAI